MRKDLHPSSLKAGPIRHETLAADLLVRIAAIRDTLIEVVPGTLDEWVTDFRRDMHPESEIVIWEKVVYDYRAICLQHPALSLSQKKEVVGRLLNGEPLVVETAIVKIANNRTPKAAWQATVQLMATMKGLSIEEADAKSEAFVRSAMEHFGDEVGVNLRGASVTLVHEFGCRFSTILAERRKAILGDCTLDEWMELEEPNETMNAIARHAVREMFSGGAVMS